MVFLWDVLRWCNVSVDGIDGKYEELWVLSEWVFGVYEEYCDDWYGCYRYVWDKYWKILLRC